MMARRFLWMPPTLFGLVLIVFAISHVIPSDPARVMAGENAPPEQVEALRHQFGLDLPLPLAVRALRRATWRPATWGPACSPSARSPRICGRACRRRSNWRSTPSCSPSLVGVPLGVVAALRRNSLLDHVVRVVTISGLAMAAFWLAILLQLLFSMWLGLTPVQGRIDGWGPDPITGFYTIDAAAARRLGDAGPVAALSRPADADAGAAGDGDDRALHPRRRAERDVEQLRVLPGGDGHPAPARRVEIHPAQRADRHADADRPDLRQPDRRRRGGGDGVRLARPRQFRGAIRSCNPTTTRSWASRCSSARCSSW